MAEVAELSAPRVCLHRLRVCVAPVVAGKCQPPLRRHRARPACPASRCEAAAGGPNAPIRAAKQTSACGRHAKAQTIACVGGHKASRRTPKLTSTGASDPCPSSSAPSARNAQLTLTLHDSQPCCPPARFPSRAAAAAAAPPLVLRFTRGGDTADPPLPRVPAPAGALSSRSSSRSPWRRAGGRRRRRGASSATSCSAAPCCWAQLARKGGGCPCCPPPFACSQVACARRGVWACAPGVGRACARAAGLCGHRHVSCTLQK